MRSGVPGVAIETQTHRRADIINADSQRERERAGEGERGRESKKASEREREREGRGKGSLLQVADEMAQVAQGSRHVPSACTRHAVAGSTALARAAGNHPSVSEA